MRIKTRGIIIHRKDCTIPMTKEEERCRLPDGTPNEALRCRLCGALLEKKLWL